MGTGPDQNADSLASIADLRALKALRSPSAVEFDKSRQSVVADGIIVRRIEGVSDRVVDDVKRVISSEENDLAA